MIPRRLAILKTVLWGFAGVLGALTAVRFAFGLGAATNLSDAAPWGLWIGFDVMAGVALAAGGFVLAGTVYIFGREKYRGFARPAVLTAFLGYVAVATGLLYDLGLPWHIWHPMIYWQYHSVLFEVAACVMLYLTVLALEFAPAVLEHPLFSNPLLKRIHAVLKRATIPLVIAGIVLSTLHQSSLGSLFLIVPSRLHELWYSPIIYVLFFVSAAGLGLMTVTLESLLAGFFFGHRVRTDLLSRLGAAAAIVLGAYAAIRLGDLAVRGVLASALDGSWQSNLFIFELGVSAILPAVLLSNRRVRSSLAGLWTCATMAAGGMVLYRLDVAFVAIARPEGMPYVPGFTEIGVSLGIVSAAALAFIFFVENFRVYEHDARAGEDPHPHAFHPARLENFAPPVLSAPRRYSLAAVAGAVLTVFLLPAHAYGPRPLPVPAQAARTVDGFAVKTSGRPRALGVPGPEKAMPAGARPAMLLMIDGNRNGHSVLFDHESHASRTGGKKACAECHHLDMPLDRNSSCHECHRDVFEPSPLFGHASHVRRTAGNAGCVKCHADPAAPKTCAAATACAECHPAPARGSRMIEPPAPRWRPAAGYMDAMHGLCVKCHAGSRDGPAHLDRCSTCHDADRKELLRRIQPGGSP